MKYLILNGRMFFTFLSKNMARMQFAHKKIHYSKGSPSNLLVPLFGSFLAFFKMAVKRGSEGSNPTVDHHLTKIAPKK